MVTSAMLHDQADFLAGRTGLLERGPRRTAAMARLDWMVAAPVAQLDRASVYGTEGHRFESCRARFGIPVLEGIPGRLRTPLGGNPGGTSALLAVDAGAASR